MFNLATWKKRDDEGGQGLTVRDSMERELTRLRDDFNSLLDRLWGGRPGLASSWFDHWGWSLDVDDRGHEYVVRAEAPGFEVEDFDVQLSGDNLVIRAERKQEGQAGNEGNFYRHERLYRSVALPAGVEADRIEASYRSGILELHLPKKREAQGKRIAVKAN
jgi:HSP20 family protein